MSSTKIGNKEKILTLESILNKPYPKDFYIFQEENIINGLDIPNSSMLTQKILEFVQTPPAIGKTIKCVIYFETENLICNYTLSYECDDGNVLPLLISRKAKYSLTPAFLINTCGTCTKNEEQQVAVLEKNMFSSVFSLYENKLDTDMTKQATEKRKALMYVEYEPYISNIGVPIQLTVYIPGVNDETNSNFEFFYSQNSLTKNKVEAQISSITEFNITANNTGSVEESTDETQKKYLNKSGNVNLFYGSVVKLIPKQPALDRLTNSYRLDMNGRANIGSAANFQLIHESNSNYVVMQCGKLEKDTFSCDFSYPINAIQAFSVALSCLYKNE